MRKRTAARFVKKMDKVLMDSRTVSVVVRMNLLQLLPTLTQSGEKELKRLLKSCEKTADAHRKAKIDLADFFAKLFYGRKNA